MLLQRGPGLFQISGGDEHIQIVHGAADRVVIEAVADVSALQQDDLHPGVNQHFHELACLALLGAIEPQAAEIIPTQCRQERDLAHLFPAELSQGLVKQRSEPMKNEDIKKTRSGELLGKLLPGLEPDLRVGGPQVQHQRDERIVKYHDLLRADFRRCLE
jgi:hypothetical protein